MPATAERSEGKGGNVLKTMAVVPRCSAPLSCAPPYAGKPPLCSRWGSALTFCRKGGFVPPSEHFPVPSSGKMLTHALTGLAIKVPPSTHSPAPPAPKLGAKRGPGVGHNFSISMPSLLHGIYKLPARRLDPSLFFHPTVTVTKPCAG